MSGPFYCVFGLFITLGLIAWVCEHKTRNRPKHMATRTRSFPRDGHSHSSFWQGCKRVDT